MKQKTIFVAIIIIILIVGIGVWKVNTSRIIQTTTEQDTFSVDQAALLQLQTDIKGITPQFIDAGRTSAQSVREQNIKDDVVVFLSVNQPSNKDYYSGLWLDAVGKRYILISQPSAGSSYDEIIDSKTGKVTNIARKRSYYLVQEGRDTVLYINNQAIYTYTLDQASPILVSGSQLLKTETYNSGTSDFQLIPEQTHTKNSIKISIFDSSQTVQNPNAKRNAMQTMNKKVRSITLSF